MAHTRPDPAELLTSQECSFLERQVRNTGRYAVFTAVDLCVALSLAIWSLVDGALSGTRFALIILVLLHARANLKQHKDAKLMGKLQQLGVLMLHVVGASVQQDRDDQGEPGACHVHDTSTSWSAGACGCSSAQRCRRTRSPTSSPIAARKITAIGQTYVVHGVSGSSER